MHVQFVFVNVYFKCTTQRFAQEGGFGQTHEISIDSYIRKIVSKLSNPMGLPDTPPWVKPLTGT